jgi:hypothetical protein
MPALTAEPLGEARGTPSIVVDHEHAGGLRQRGVVAGGHHGFLADMAGQPKSTESLGRIMATSKSPQVDILA